MLLRYLVLLLGLVSRGDWAGVNTRGHRTQCSWAAPLCRYMQLHEECGIFRDRGRHTRTSVTCLLPGTYLFMYLLLIFLQLICFW